MFDLQASSKNSKKQQGRQGQSSRYMQSQRFIPPTHPAYVITPNFQADHILKLQEEFDTNYIAMGMQTSKKKLARMPDTPDDRFFIVVDDSKGPLLLQGEFLMIKSRVVNYPIANSIEKVISEFKEYIGLGRYQVTEQYIQNNHQAFQSQEQRQTTILVKSSESGQGQHQSGMSSLLNNLNKKDIVHSSTVTTSNISKISLREISSLKTESRVVKGRLFIYDNRKDSQQFKIFVSELKSRFFISSSIKFIERIDQYNNQVRLSRQTDNIVLMSHYSFVNLAKYFIKYRSFALFLRQDQQLDLYCQHSVAIATSRKDRLLAFIEIFVQDKSKIIDNDDRNQREITNKSKQKQKGEPLPLKTAKNPLSPAENSSINVKQRGKQGQIPDVKKQNGKQIVLRSFSPLSTKTKPQIKLVRITDLNKNPLQQSKSLQPIKENKAKIPIFQEKQQTLPIAQNNTNQTSSQSQIIKQQPLQEINKGNPIHDISFQNKSVETKKSKIKRLKSAKKIVNEEPPQVSAEISPTKNRKQQGKYMKKQGTNNRPLASMMGHLRMGSDDQKSRSKQRQRPRHSRVASDSENLTINVPQLKISVPPPRQQSQPNDYYSLQPQVEQNIQFRLKSQKPLPFNEEVSLRLLPQIKEKPFFQQLNKRSPQVGQKSERSIISYNRKPKQKNKQGMAQKLGKADQEKEEMTVVRKPKMKMGDKVELNNRQKEQIKVEEQEVQELCLFTHPSPEDEAQMQKLKKQLKVKADQYKILDVAKNNRKVLKAHAIPPTFQTVNQSEIELNPTNISKNTIQVNQPPFSNVQSVLQSKIDNQLQSPPISNISSIKLKKNYKEKQDENKRKRFTFGIDAKQPHENNLDEQQAKSAIRPNKSRSMQQVHRVFNKYKIKPAQQHNQVQPKKTLPDYYYNNPKQSPSQKPITSNISSRSNRSRVGKIYRNLKKKAANSVIDSPRTKSISLTPNRSLYPLETQAGFRKGEIIPSRVGSNYEYHPNKSIEDLIDLSKYDKIIENGVTVYRSKFPIQVAHYNPPSLTVSPSASLLSNYQPFKTENSDNLRNIPQSLYSPKNQTVTASMINRPIIKSTQKAHVIRDINTKQNRRPQQQKLRRSKSGAIPLVRYSPKQQQKQNERKIVIKNNQKLAPNTKQFTTDSIGIQCQADPFNSLVNKHNQQLLRNLTNRQKTSSKLSASKVSSYDPNKKLTKSVKNPIQDMLFSKISSSNNSPSLKYNFQLRNIQKQSDASSASSQELNPLNDSQNQTQKLVLYLIEKIHSPQLIEQLSGIKSRKDSLITFKHEKQLSQQLPQTINIYDIVYVVPAQLTKDIQKLVKEYPNCYLVELAQGKTKIKGNKVTLSSLKYLNDVTELLLKQSKPKSFRNKSRKGVSPSSRIVQQKSFGFSPNRSYFVPSYCHSRVCHCAHIPQTCLHD